MPSCSTPFLIPSTTSRVPPPPPNKRRRPRHSFGSSQMTIRTKAPSRVRKRAGLNRARNKPPSTRKSSSSETIQLLNGSGEVLIATRLPAFVAWLAAASAGPGWLIDDRVTGLLVPPEDANALAAAITRVLGDLSLAGRLAEAGREAYRARFSEPAVVAQFIDLFEKVSR